MGAAAHWLRSRGHARPARRALGEAGVGLAEASNATPALCRACFGEPGSALTAARVKKTGRNRSGYRGYRSNWPGLVPVPAGFKLA